MESIQSSSNMDLQFKQIRDLAQRIATLESLLGN